MKKIIIVGLFIIVILLSGCGVEENLTPKQMITKQLVKEINTCHNKFTADSQAFMYCEKVLGMADEYVKSGFFDDETAQDINQIVIQQNITDNEVDEEFIDFKDDILGSI